MWPTVFLVVENLEVFLDPFRQRLLHDGDGVLRREGAVEELARR
jgi:hypothetical protein